jgi:hypothetical protein
MLLCTLQIPQILFWRYSIRVIPGTIPAKFEFHSKFHRNCFINLAGPSAKFDSTGIPGIAHIPQRHVTDQTITSHFDSILGQGGFKGPHR